MHSFELLDADLKPAPAGDHEIVHEPATGLMWTAANVGGDEVTWDEAKTAAAALTLGGFTDWRLPTVEELFALADRSRYSPAIDTAAFPNCESDFYWASSVDASDPGSYAWYVYFYDGGSHIGAQSNTGFVRAVRSVAAPAASQ